MSRSNDIANITASVLDGVTKAEVGLGNVDNTADSAKPVSTAQQSAIDGLAHQSVPHIIPDVLYPSYVASGTSNKLLDGTTSHSGAFGTAQSDGRKYYYTNIAGSKPIKDPRIGAHFGSQRHKTKSLQLLEQETATHGADVFSADGREWLRLVGGSTYNSSAGNYVGVVSSTTSFVEVVGYFSGVNLIAHPDNTNRHYEYKIDGGSETSFDTFEAAVDTPLGSRYVDAGSVLSVVTGQTLGIHTFKIRLEDANDKLFLFGIELIAQDTTSTARRSEIKIPKQNVVSYGKKFEVGSDDLDNAVHPHYDPFNGFTSGSSVSSYIDTATSLGVEKWKHSSTYYRPYNGGRVVKWVDSSGTIKTSVTLIPPNAKSMANSSSLTNATAKANASASNDTFYPTFEAHTTDVNEDNLHEVAKTFHFREFGNGSANGGTGGTYADASMLALNGTDDIAYVMDDGLTSLSGDDMEGKQNKDIGGAGPDDALYFTFIGTGVRKTCEHYPTDYTIAQNLPYGTHILKVVRQDTNGGDPDITIDGVAFTPNVNDYGWTQEITFYQPKKPPIPEDAVVLADYMLMADFVKRTPAINDPNRISKGVRLISASRDIFYDSAGSASVNNMKPMIEAWLHNAYTGFSAMFNGATNQDSYAQLPYFGTTEGDFVTRAVGDSAKLTVSLTNSSGSLETSNVTLTSNTTISSQPTIPEGGSDSASHHTFVKSDGVLGSNTVKFLADGQNSSTNYDWLYMAGMTVATPIHTSSHYQPFETPFLHELVGGDRNMEQTNLIVSPDGKTWDEVTRDTSYIGNLVVSANTDTTQTWNSVVVLDEWRGGGADAQFKDQFNKYFAIAYDQLICLKDGDYRIETTGTHDGEHQIDINDAGQTRSNSSHSGLSWLAKLSRGDRIKLYADWGTGALINNHFYITKL